MNNRYGKTGRSARAIVLGLTLLVGVTTLSAQQRLVMVKKESLSDDYLAEVILKKAYSYLGIELTIETLPPQRALIHVQQGLADGELQRIYLDPETIPTLIRVPTSHNFSESCVFFTKNIPFTSLEDFKDYRFVYTRGIVGYLPLLKIFNKTLTVNSDDQMYKMVQLGRADFMITGRVNGLYHLKQMNIDGIYPLLPPIRTYPLYHYLHEKNRDLVPRIDEVLQQMQASGELDALRQEAIYTMLGHDLPSIMRPETPSTP